MAKNIGIMHKLPEGNYKKQKQTFLPLHQVLILIWRSLRCIREMKNMFMLALIIKS